MIRFPCPNCQRKLGVDDKLAGKAGMCPHCKTKFSIPWESTLEAQAPPPVAPPPPQKTSDRLKKLVEDEDEPKLAPLDPEPQTQKTSDRLKKQVEEKEEEPMLLEAVEEEEEKPKTKTSSNFEVIDDDDDEDEDEDSKPKKKKSQKDRDDDTWDDDEDEEDDRPRKDKGGKNGKRSRDDDDDDDDRDDDDENDRPVWKTDKPKKKKKKRRPKRNPLMKFVNIFTVTLGIGILVSMLACGGGLLVRELALMPFVIAMMVNLVAQVWFLIEAWKDEPIHAIACFIVPFYSLFYLVTRFGIVQRPFYLGICALAIFAMGAVTTMIAAAVHEEKKPGPRRRSEFTPPAHVFVATFSPTYLKQESGV